jgi:hypothetical protein
MLTARRGRRAGRVEDLQITPMAQERISEAEHFEVPTTNLGDRTVALRRTEVRMAGNSRSRVGTRRADHEPGVTSRGNRTT